MEPIQITVAQLAITVADPEANRQAAADAVAEAAAAGARLVVLPELCDSGYVFDTWSGCSGTGPACGVTMDAAYTVTATFGIAQTLTISRSGSGTGTVTSSDGGINCGVDCSGGEGCPRGYGCRDIIVVFTRWQCTSNAQCPPAAISGSSGRRSAPRTATPARSMQLRRLV